MYTHSNPGAKSAPDVTAILATTWNTRVAVRKPRIDLSRYYETDAPDYPLALVPFRLHPRFVELSEAVQRRILAGAWVAYNEKTIAVEDWIVSPACMLLMRERVPGLDIVELKRIVTQTIVDEEFHILMCLDACAVTRRQHGLEGLELPVPVVVSELQRYVADAGRSPSIVQIAFATVAELTINAYLSLLANDATIQPLNRETTSLHRQDESSHNKIFRILARRIYEHMSPADRVRLRDGLELALLAFTKPDPRAWLAILDFVGIPDAEALVSEGMASGSNPSLSRDCSSLDELLSELSITSLGTHPWSR